MSSPLDHARRLLALAQSGLHFTQDPYDRERYEEVARLAAALMAGSLPAPGETADAILENWRADQGYVTPKIEVRGAIFRTDPGGDQVLLVRETADGRWTLPGGWADVNEGPREAVEKEIVQESGYTARAVKLAAVYDRHRHAHPPSLFHAWKLFFLCEITGGGPRTSIETSAVAFHPLAGLPELSVSRTTPEQILKAHAHFLDPGLPTEFD